MKITNIVIPLNKNGGKFKNDTELRFALRSINKHFTSPYKITIISEHLPNWLHGVRHINVDCDLKKAVKIAAEEYPNGFFWFYDDLCLLKDLNAEQMKITPTSDLLVQAEKGWAGLLEKLQNKIKLELKIEKQLNYSSPHGPYWYNKEMIDEAFNDLGKMSSKYPFENWILNKKQWPNKKGISMQVYFGDFDYPFDPDNRFCYLNYCETGLTESLIKYLKNRFEIATRFEKDFEGNCKPLKEKSSKEKNIIEEAVKKTNLKVNSIIEIGVGFNSDIKKINAELKILVEPNIELFAKAQKQNKDCKAFQLAILEKRKGGKISIKDDLENSYIKEDSDSYVNVEDFSVFGLTSLDVIVINSPKNTINVLNCLTGQEKLIQLKKQELKDSVKEWLITNKYYKYLENKKKIVYKKKEDA